MPKTSNEIRQTFIDYFVSKGHTHVPSSSLIPANDPTLLFTNAGMVQFKDVFLGKEKRSYSRAVTCQRCLRASGKHNDLDNVGITTRHHTFFEMLGNFSFGDYFKREAIQYAWDFLTKVLKIPQEKLWITVHEKDTEAADIWLKEIKVDAIRFRYCGDEDNFWAMGETGPCGYCSEIFYDHGEPLKGCPPGEPGSSDHDNDRYVEIWNLVFMQFERDAAGNLTPLPKPSVDTGMGLERIAAVKQEVHDNYETDILRNLMIFMYFTANREHKNKRFTNVGKRFTNDVKFEPSEAEDAPKIDMRYWSIDDGCVGYPDGNLKFSNEEVELAWRIAVDHIRATVFLIIDGVLPANEGAGSVLRSIIRRAVYHLYKIDIQNILNLDYSYMQFFQSLIEPLLCLMKDAYPEIAKLYNAKIKGAQEIPLEKIIKQEIENFSKTLARGEKILENEISKLKGKVIPGLIVFNLHDTYGFPAILTEDIARARGLTIDKAGFDALMAEQKERSRAASKFGSASELKLDISGATEFVGYEEVASISKIRGLFKEDGSACDHLACGEKGIIILDKTPFYAEAGGQVGDQGLIFNPDTDLNFIVTDTQKYGSLHLHYGEVNQGMASLNDDVKAEIDLERRQAIKLNHSSAHLLHKALQIVLGEHATQRGSAVDEKRLRFDFAHFNALTKEELEKIEQIVNKEIRANLEVKTEIKTLAEAQKQGVMALFGEKYGEKVRVVQMGNFSEELCAGTHVSRTGEIGILKIIQETSLASGIRRIEAVTGENALIWLTQSENELKKAALMLSANREQLTFELGKILEEKRTLEKENTQFKNELALQKSKDLASQAITIDNIKVLSAKIENIDNKALRGSVDSLKQKLAPAIIVLATVQNEKIQLIAGVTKEISAKFNAGSLLQFIAKQIGGSGGGRPDMAQGGGTNVAALDAALSSVENWVKAGC